MVDIQTKRVYEPYEEDDGYRVLVDRLWPRGLTKERVHYDEWDRSLAPSTATRKAFGHKAQNWDGFAAAYTAELDANPKAAAFADRLAQGGHPHVDHAQPTPGQRPQTARQRHGVGRGAQRRKPPSGCS